MKTLSNKVLESSYLLIASKMLQRVIGLVSIMILARLLSPEDFSIVALTAIIIYFFNMLSNVGTEQYIIQKEQVSPQDLNTAWTIDLISKFALWLILIISAGFISEFFERPKLQSAIYVMSMLLPLNALKNPGIFLLKSELNYNKLFWLTLIQKVISFIVVITIAFFTPSFWALIIADLVASLIFILGSYKIHEFRPRLSLINNREQWLFSKWLLLKGIVGYIRSQIDTLFVSKLFSASTLGQYYIVRNIAMLPNNNILTPAIEPLLAAFKTERDNQGQLAFQIRVCLFAVSLFATPIAFFIWNFPKPIIDTLLGVQWVNSDTLISAMAPLFFYFPFLLIQEQALLAKQRIKTLIVFDLLSLIFLAIGFITLPLLTVEDIALFRGVSGIATCLILAISINYCFPVLIGRIAVLFVPIIFASSSASYLTSLIVESNFSSVFTNLLFIGTYYVLLYLFILGILLFLFFKTRAEVQFIYTNLKFKILNLYYYCHKQ